MKSYCIASNGASTYIFKMIENKEITFSVCCVSAGISEKFGTYEQAARFYNSLVQEKHTIPLF